MSPSEKAAQAKLDAKVAGAARELIDGIHSVTTKRGGAEGFELVQVVFRAELLVDLKIAVKASEALAEVTAEGDAS
jgi:hypothetical protein